MKTTSIFFVIFFYTCMNATAQNAVMSSGSNSSGAGGTGSYSVGQIVLTTIIAPSGSLAQGIQQAFEIQILLGTEIRQVNLIIAAYPNPTSSLLILDVGNYECSDTKFKLIDLHGRVLMDKKVIDSKTSIIMDNFSEPIYLLNVLDNNKILKTFKILKNN